MQLKSLLEMLSGAQDQREADDAIKHDDDRREHGVAGDRVTARVAGNHNRGYQCDFDHSHRDSEQDRTERLAEPQRQHFCVMNGREDASAEQDAGKNQDGHGVRGGDMGEFQRQKSDREHWRNPCPGRN